ncbi:MAG: sugar-transfer associated ATP-grasp domain-containing protein [Pseudomonadota bacterium]
METKNWRLYEWKRSFELFPAARNEDGFAAPAFLKDFYARKSAARSLPRRAADALIGAGFRAWTSSRAAKIARRFGMGDAWAAEAAAIARSTWGDPKEIALFRSKDVSEFKAYLRKFEHTAINKRINPTNWRDDCILKFKDRFDARCAEEGFPTPRTFARNTGGKLEANGVPLGAEFCVKPVYGTGGVGFTHIADAPPLPDPAAVEAFLRSRIGAKVDWVAQDYLRTHANLADIALDALATMRISTMLNEVGAPEAVTTVLRFAGKPGARVDNIAAGGLMAHIDPETGALGRGCYGKRPGDFDAHPETGAAITGRIVPFWRQALEMALAAHARVTPAFALVGWDIAPTENGPVIIEANGMPCSTIAQRAVGRGAGDQRYGELIAWHLAKAPE